MIDLFGFKKRKELKLHKQQTRDRIKDLTEKRTQNAQQRFPQIIKEMKQTSQLIKDCSEDDKQQIENLRNNLKSLGTELEEVKKFL